MRKMITTERIRQLIAEDKLYLFYTGAEWRHLRMEVLEDDKHECQICKSKGRYTPAEIVHHVKHVRKFPELALCKYYTDAVGVKRRQLISVCHNCHEQLHGHRQKEKSKLLTEERW